MYVVGGHSLKNQLCLCQHFYKILLLTELKCDRTYALLSVRRYSPVTWVMIRGWQVWQGAALPSSSSEFHWQQIVFLFLLNNLLILAPPPTWWWALPIHWGIPWGLEATLWFWNLVNFFWNLANFVSKSCQLCFWNLVNFFLKPLRVWDSIGALCKGWADAGRSQNGEFQ